MVSIAPFYAVSDFEQNLIFFKTPPTYTLVVHLMHAGNRYVPFSVEILEKKCGTSVWLFCVVILYGLYVAEM